MDETLDQLVETVMDIARELPIDEATIVIRDRIDKHFRPLTGTLLRAKDTIRTWHGEVAWDIYDKHSPEMQSLNQTLRDFSEIGER